MQTWAVHMRAPRALFRELGPRGFFAFHLVVGGNILAALIHPVLLAGVVLWISTGHPLLGAEGQSVALTWLFGMSLTSGYLVSIVLGLRGLARRGLLVHGWVLRFVLIHWVILSYAAWRALYKLIRDPQEWEKTEHGLAQSSRRAAIAGDSREAALQPQLRSAA
jgi:hypothetical protein